MITLYTFDRNRLAKLGVRDTVRGPVQPSIQATLDPMLAPLPPAPAPLSPASPAEPAAVQNAYQTGPIYQPSGAAPESPAPLTLNDAINEPAADPAPVSPIHAAPTPTIVINRANQGSGVTTLPPDYQNAIWIDIINPNPQEREMIEQELNINLPKENASSSFLRPMSQQGDALYLSASMLDMTRDRAPAPVTFILLPTCVITYHNDPFDHIFTNMGNLQRVESTTIGVLEVLLSLMVQSTLKSVESAASNLEALSSNIYGGKSNVSHTNEYLLEQSIKAGRDANFILMLEDSLSSFDRLLNHISLPTTLRSPSGATQGYFDRLQHEVRSIVNLCGLLTKNVEFIQSGALGHTVVKQNETIEILTKIMLFLTPPGLVLTFYDVLFKEGLEEHGGWERLGIVALAIIVTTVLTFVFFRKRNK